MEALVHTPPRARAAGAPPKVPTPTRPRARRDTPIACSWPQVARASHTRTRTLALAKKTSAMSCRVSACHAMSAPVRACQRHVSACSSRSARNMSLSRLSTAASSPDAPVAAEEVTQVKETPFVLKGELTNEDAAGMVASNGFPIAPDMLILQAKKVLAANNGCDDPDLLADDFKFVAPVVGPLSKKEFTNAFASFKIDDAFPDINANFHNFWVDPFEPGRVWYVTRATATHTGTLAGAIPPTGIRVDSPPQANSMTFNVDGQCTQLTVGYVLDKQLGNTGGLGGVFGILYAIGYGLPFPEAQPWEKSWQYALFQQTSGFATAVRKTLGL